MEESKHGQELIRQKPKTNLQDILLFLQVLPARKLAIFVIFSTFQINLTNAVQKIHYSLRYFPNLESPPFDRTSTIRDLSLHLSSLLAKFDAANAKKLKKGIEDLKIA